MVHGIAIMGLNGCGKSTLTHEICKYLNYFEIDLEDYFFQNKRNHDSPFLSINMMLNVSI